MSEPRKHHYLPQFYLRGFSPDGKSVFQIEKASCRYYSGNIKNTAAIRDFHEIDGECVEDPNAVEKRLAALEGGLSTDLKNLLNDGISNISALGEVVALLSLLRMRVPVVKEHIHESLASTIKMMAKGMEKAGRLPKSPPGLEETLSVDNLQFTVTNWRCLELMFDMASSSDILSLLGSMRATLYRLEGEESFVTSDQPVSLFHPSITEDHKFGVGPAIKEVEITLPLSSNALLKLDHESGDHKEMLATKEDVIEYNRRTMVSAHKYVFSGFKPDSVIDALTPVKEIFSVFVMKTSKLAENGIKFNVTCLSTLRIWALNKSSNLTVAINTPSS